MHIAIVLDSGSRRAFDLAAELIDCGHKVDLVLVRTNRDLVVPDNARLFLIEGGSDGTLGWLRLASVLNWDTRLLFNRSIVRQIGALVGYAERQRPDCLLLNLTSPKSAILLGCHLLAEFSPIIAVVHSHIKHRRYRYRARYRRLCASATHLVGVSRGVSSSLAAAAGVASEEVRTIYNGLNLIGVRDRMKEPAGHPWLQNPDVPVILAAGRLTGAKDYPTLIRAIAHLATRRLCRLIILGEGKARKRLERLVKRLDLADRVSLPGWVENPFAFMSRASVFAVSSRREGFSMVLLQALACGCPCVSTDCDSGPAEILQNGDYGPLVPVGDDDALADAIERVLNDPPDKQMLRDRAGHFSSDRTVAAYDGLISTVVRDSGDSSHR